MSVILTLFQSGVATTTIREKKKILMGQISNLFLMKDSFKRENVPQKELLKDLSFMLITIYTNSVYGKCLVKTFTYVFMSKIKPPFQKIIFTKDITKVSVESKFFFTTLAECHSTIVSFDLWMSKGAYDVFELVIKFKTMIGNQNM